jgi:hypothetical protein
MGYGSYSAKEPNMEEHDNHYKDPKRIILKSDNEDSTFEKKFYYISLESLYDVKI